MRRWLAMGAQCLTSISLACNGFDGGAGEGNPPGSDVVSAGGSAGGEVSGGRAGDGGTSGAAGTGSAYAACDPPATGEDDDAEEPGSIGFDTYQEGSFEGRVSSVSAQRMQITIAGGPLTFTWRGPALGSAFVVDEAVTATLTHVSDGLAPPRMSIVTSSNASAVAIDGAPYTGLSKQPGATTTLRGLDPSMPELVYGLTSCCASINDITLCDYSALDARFQGDSIAVPAGVTGIIGPWYVTNVHSTYFEQRELVWLLRVTLLGPGQPRTGDAGL